MLVSGGPTAVVSEAPTGPEGPGAGLAAVGPGSTVDHLMDLQVVVLAEALVADAAGERLLTTVDPIMSDQVLGDTEAPPTDLADVGPLATVDPEVELQTGRRREVLQTLRACEWLPL